MNPRILIVSPVPSHNHHEGNAARVRQLVGALQNWGAIIHFVLYDLYGSPETTINAMRQDWDHVSVVKPQKPITPSLPASYHVDDPFDPALGEHVAALCRDWSYDLCIVNYVWLSKVLEYVPSGVKKVVDTHDVFGDRQRLTIEQGMNAEDAWYYTTPGLEAMALKRADTVIAIQDVEAAYFRGLLGGAVEVVTIGHPLPPRFLAPSTGKAVTVGYLGSDNVWNDRSFRALENALDDFEDQLGNADWMVAGSICRKLGDSIRHFRPIGRVDRLVDFYEAVDIVVNPMLGGTGLKIKSVEALSFGRVLLSTQDGILGLPVVHPAQECGSVPELAKWLVDLIGNPSELAKIRRDGCFAYNEYYRRQLDIIYKLAN